MKRILLFLALAAGGIGLLGWIGSGFRGSNAQGPTPEIKLMPGDPNAKGRDPVRTNDFPGPGRGRRGGGAPVAVDPSYAVNFTDAHAVTYVDRADGTMIEIPNAPVASVSMRETATMRDPAGSPGIEWKGIHIVIYKDEKHYTRAIAEALRANPLNGRKGLEQFDITADEGFAATTPVPLASGDKDARGTTVIRIKKNVLIHDYERNLDIVTSEATVDVDARAAEGNAPVEVESDSYVIRGRGFRIDAKTQHFEILESTEFEAIDLAGDPMNPAANAESEGMRPRRIQTKGRTAIDRHTEEKEPFTSVRMEGGVHVEMDGGQQLDTESVALRLVDRKEVDRKGGASRAGDPTTGKMSLELMHADGNVRYEGKDKGGAFLTAQGPSFDVEFRDRQVHSMRLGGRSLVTWRGELALAGERPSDHIVSARASESILFAPDAATPGGALVDLVGTARVECGRAPTDVTPQRLAADRVTLRLRHRQLAPELVRTTTSPDRARRTPQSEWIATAFSATGGVVLDGPRLTGAAREIAGFDLDQPKYHVTATGPDAHLEVAEDPEPKAASRATASATAGGPAAPRKQLLLERLVARENAMGSLRVSAGEGAAKFAGDTIQFTRTTGAEIRALPGKDAHLTLEGRENRDRSVDANTIWLRPGPGERVLETAGRTHTVFWVGDEEPAKSSTPPGRGRRVVEVRSPSRIDLSGTVGSKDVDAALAVTLIDGGSISARTDGVVTDRLTATTIEMALVETVPAPGEMGFALSGARADKSASATPSSTTATTTPGAGKPAAREPGRFVIDSDRLILAVGTEPRAGSAGGLRRVHAEGNVKAAGDDSKQGPMQFEGSRFDYDAATGAGILLGAEKKLAVVTLGHEPAVDRLVSPRIGVTFEGGQMTRAVFAAPVRGVFHTKPRSDAGAAGNRHLDQFRLESKAGALTVEGDKATVDGSADALVLVESTSRDATGAAVGDPMWLTTPHLMITTSKPLGAPGASLKDLVASGAGTRIETGTTPANRMSATGDTIRFELPQGARTGSAQAEGILRITSASGKVLVRTATSSLAGHDVSYDLGTRKISAGFSSLDHLGGSK